VRSIVALAAVASLLAVGCAVRKAPPPSTALAGEEALTPVWSVPVEAASEVQVEAAPGGFVVATPSGAVMRFAAADGARVWKIDLGAKVAGNIAVAPGPPGVDAGWGAVPLEDGTLAAFSLATGERIARWASGSGPFFLAAAREKILAVAAAGPARLYARDAAGALWETRLPASPTARPASCAGTFLLGLSDGRLLGLDAESGAIRWKKNLGSPVLAQPACRGRRAFLATADNRFHALRLHSHSAGILWRARSGADPAAPPVALKGTVLFLSKDTYIYAFDESNGHLRFRARLDRRPGPAALLGDLVLVAGAHARRLDAFRLPEGRGAGGFDLPEGAHFLTPPVVSDGRVAIAVARYGEESCRLVGLAPGRAAPASP